MKNCMPDAYQELVENCEILERHYKDMMVKEFSGVSLDSRILVQLNIKIFFYFQFVEYNEDLCAVL